MSNYKYNSDYDYTTSYGNVTVDLGSGVDTSLIGSCDTIILDPGTWNNSTYTGIGAQGSTYAIGGASGSISGLGGGYTFSTTSGFNGTSSPRVNLDNNGIEIKQGADIKIDGKSLSEFMDRVEARLGILQPKPELLEKFEALKQAYEHYKTLEALCMGDIPKDPNGR